ncbi:porin [Flavobacterium sp. N1994]|uniref:porin n=1 Tax=Flavobacterium sp. N1994 TaxID=2986827 RepID=UPI00222289C5|nr:porin [Flavobacterium sp. N1994]
MKRYFCLGLFLMLYSVTFSQEKKEVKFIFSGFFETFYAYDFNQPDVSKKLPFMYNYNRHNEPNLNIGLLRARVAYQNVYASVAVHAGTYVDDNYANEKMKYLSEAYFGMYLDSLKKQTIEIGILPSYIGFESATTATNLTLTRSILAENSPYFMTGVKYNYRPNDKWSFSGLLTNGWQRINTVKSNIPPSLGSQISYKPNAKALFNWSTFFGKELYLEQWSARYFSNFYWDNQWNTKWRTIMGFDMGIQTNESTDQKVYWLSPVIITQYSLSSKWQTAVRLEYYQDANAVLIATDDEFRTFGTSFNLDYFIISKLKCRAEARYLKNKGKVFTNGTTLVDDNFFVTTSLSYEF